MMIGLNTVNSEHQNIIKINISDSYFIEKTITDFVKKICIDFFKMWNISG